MTTIPLSDQEEAILALLVENMQLQDQISHMRHQIEELTLFIEGNCSRMMYSAVDFSMNDYNHSKHYYDTERNK